MIYLIKNIYFRNNQYHYDLINENKEIKIARRSDKIFDIGTFVEVEFQDQKIKINDKKIEQPQNILDYYENGKMSRDELKMSLAKFINQITNPNYLKILDETINKNEDFYIYPAAKSIHHAYIGGLAEHTLNILTLAQSFISQYDLDKQLLYMGILLHDYAKVTELTHYGLNYSLEGNLVGHITMCVEEIGYIARMYEINQEKDIILLKHLILSHHGKLEYGSPKEPMFIEAYVLSILDDADAKINTLTKNLKDLDKYTLSSPINAFDRKRFIKI